MCKTLTLGVALALAALASTPSLAQTAPAAVAVKQTEQYCMVMATSKLFSTKVTVTLDYGQETKFFGGGANIVKDEAGKIQAFNSVVDALNYMNSQGWEFVNAYVITVANQNVYHYLMRKRLV
jgi:hypothetical protein